VQTVNLVINLFTSAKKEEAIDNDKFTAQLYAIYKKNILYASPDVVNAFGDLMQYLYKHDSAGQSTPPQKILRHLTKLMGAMRKDLGLSNKNLGKDAQNLLRVMITDFEVSMK